MTERADKIINSPEGLPVMTSGEKIVVTGVGGNLLLLGAVEVADLLGFSEARGFLIPPHLILDFVAVGGMFKVVQEKHQGKRSKIQNFTLKRKK